PGKTAHILETGLHKLIAQSPVLRKPLDTGADRLAIGGVDEQCPLAGNLGQRAAIGTENRRATGLRLEYGKAKPLVERRIKQSSGAGEQGGLVRLVYKTGDADARLHLQR